MKKEYPSRLFHKTPSWVEDGAVFHIRIRCAAENEVVLIQPDIPEALLSSAGFYTEKERWFAHLFLLMPDHIHALISFPEDQVMSRTVADWKRYQNKLHGICWQDNFFDHRIRNTAEYLEKAAYIRNNPVVKGLCADPESWPWVYEAERDFQAR
jgi:REP element-mobilizing transposase RayT